MKKKTLLISGSTGIAAATARLAASQGARVFVVSRTLANCRALSESIRSAGGECGFHHADLTSAEQVGELFEQVAERYGRIDALYNVAGVSGRSFGDGPVHECSEEGWRRTIETNLTSVFLMCRAALGRMLLQPLDGAGLRGSILNMTSVLGYSPAGRRFATHAYATSRAAVIGLTKSLASYYAADKIRVNAIAPALVRTPMSERAQSDEETLRWVEGKQPLTGGILDAEAVARASLFLLGDDAAAMTGEVVGVDGGWAVS